MATEMKDFIDEAAKAFVPERVANSLADYVFHGVLCGGFLCAVLRNDLIEAINRADTYNIGRLKEIAMFVHWNVPANICGNEANVSNHIAQMREAREKEKGAEDDGQ